MTRESGLTDETARRVLQRAAQLDASSRLNVSVADLRAAAVAAGIAEDALEQALAELGVEQPRPGDTLTLHTAHTAAGDVISATHDAPRRRSRLRTAIFVIAALLAGSAVGATLMHRALVVLPGGGPEFLIYEPALESPEQPAPITPAR